MSDGIRDFVWRFVKGVLFRIDAETAHRITVALLRMGIRLGRFPLRIASGTSRDEARGPLGAASAPVFGMSFRSRVGLAAGFDKDCEILEGLPELGFGFAEIGTVTPRPQPGNPRPRLFRDPEKQAVFNRMGFNGLGATVVSMRLGQVRSSLPEGFRVGVNLGKNKDTSLEDAASDYARAVEPFDGLADYLVVNVSSPNTPGLRSLQTIEALRPITGAVLSVISRWKRKPPLLLKLAPEVKGQELSGILERSSELGIDGWILTNTLSGNWRRSSGEELPGGWSGGPLREESLHRLQEARRSTSLPIISVGGILSAEDALRRIEAGADLVQLYSGWIFGGPAFPARIFRVFEQKKSPRP